MMDILLTLPAGKGYGFGLEVEDQEAWKRLRNPRLIFPSVLVTIDSKEHESNGKKAKAVWTDIKDLKLIQEFIRWIRHGQID